MKKSVLRAKLEEERKNNEKVVEISVNSEEKILNKEKTKEKTSKKKAK